MYNKEELVVFNLLTEEARQTGRTYNMVKKAIAKAVANPRKEVHIVFRNTSMVKLWALKIKKENSSFKIPNLKLFTHTGHIRKFGGVGEYGKSYSEFVFYDHEVFSEILKSISRHLPRFTDTNSKTSNPKISGE